MTRVIVFDLAAWEDVDSAHEIRVQVTAEHADLERGFIG
jgi:hypothetical protein